MDLIILLVSVASLSANVYMAKKISDWLKITPLEVQVGEVEPVLKTEVFYLTTDQVEKIDKIPPPQVDESQLAWRNATGLPAAGPPSVSPSMPPPVSGPLERPYGFPG